MSRRLAYPALLALPFLAGVAVLKGLTVEIDTFHGTDAGLYHLPTIRHFARGGGLDGYPAAQTPLFHLLFAGWGKVVGFELWRLRLLEVVISYAGVLVMFRMLVRRGLRPAAACALALLLALSPYYFGASFTLLTDNLGILLALVALDRFDRFGAAAERRDFVIGCLATGAAVLTRQSLAWLALVGAVYLLRSPWPLARKAGGAAALAAVLAPFAALVIDWGGLVPPGADPASCGVCGEDSGAGPLTLRTVGFTIALLGLYAAVVYGPVLARRLRPGLLDMPPSMLLRGTRAGDVAGAAMTRARRLAPAPRALALAAAAGVALLLVSPLAYDPGAPGRPGDAGYLWQVADRLPELLGSSLVFWPLLPAGALALFLLVRRAEPRRKQPARPAARGSLSLPSVYLASFLIAALPVGLAYQKYFDPFVLIALALFARRDDLRDRVDYAGIAVLAVGFVAYALSFAG
jgi:hypothetical protein